MLLSTAVSLEWPWETAWCFCPLSEIRVSYSFQYFRSNVFQAHKYTFFLLRFNYEFGVMRGDQIIVAWFVSDEQATMSQRSHLLFCDTFKLYLRAECWWKAMTIALGSSISYSFQVSKQTGRHFTSVERNFGIKNWIWRNGMETPTESINQNQLWPMKTRFDLREEVRCCSELYEIEFHWSMSVFVCSRIIMNKLHPHRETCDHF